MENADIRDLTMDGLQIVPEPFEENIAKFDLTLTEMNRLITLSLCSILILLSFNSHRLKKWKEFSFIYWNKWYQRQIN
ncbi:hypothetical protein ACEQPO_02220 [Bacillus sp. SL00103]